MAALKYSCISFLLVQSLSARGSGALCGIALNIPGNLSVFPKSVNLLLNKRKRIFVIPIMNQFEMKMGIKSTFDVCGIAHCAD